MLYYAAAMVTALEEDRTESDDDVVYVSFDEQGL